MSQPHRIQFVAQNAPLRQVVVQKGDKVVVVVPLNQVYEFVHDDIFKALQRFFS
jgi:hypothetical protein